MNRRRLVVTLLLTLAIAWGSLAVVLAAGLEPKLGLDLQGGFSVTLTAPEGTDPEVLNKAVDIMRRRIENLGQVQEPEISVQGDRRIVVQLPGVQDRERALAAVGTTGQLSFRPVLEANVISPAFLDGTLPLPEDLQETTTTEAGATTTTTVAPVIPPNLDPDTGLTIVVDVDEEAYIRSEDGLVYHVGPAFLTGADIVEARAVFTGASPTQSSWVVEPTFTSDGAQKFEDATATLSVYPAGDPRRQLAIVVDDVVFSAPQVSPDVPSGEGLDAGNVIITVGGGEDQQTEAEDLGTILRYGALPTTFEREREVSVSATLGEDSLRAGLLAGLGGLILVAIAMVLYYRALGLVAVVGLSVFGSLLLTTIILLGEFQGTTLTLAGVTGIIVSIGITADSYIVFFERIKEEHRKGRQLRPAVDVAFKRAFHTIVTADTVTFAASLLLWALAIGPVKGFAITLGLATLIDVFVAYFYTRPAVMLLSRGRFGEGGAMTIEGAMGHSEEMPAVIS